MNGEETKQDETPEEKPYVFKPPWGPNKDSDIKLPAEVARKNLWFKLTRVAQKGHSLTIGADASLEEMEAEWVRIMEERDQIKHEKC